MGASPFCIMLEFYGFLSYDLKVMIIVTDKVIILSIIASFL